ncbi:hypothetical protein EYF80_026254 [Liparis tanakae]|uniref:Uncharacterized protein n=1 Tax=Liparis tanakae TaxID=230148 RepID=A0A4Z2HFE0_9TELE|nr:hypothetical protein EYF80_026254 [Liparis tanakae]
MSTWSMRWMTPFVVTMSFFSTILMPLTVKVSPSQPISMVLPSAVSYTDPDMIPSEHWTLFNRPRHKAPYHLYFEGCSSVVTERDFYMTYSEGAELIGDIQDFLHVVANTADDPIDDMDHAVCGHLIAVDDPGTVHEFSLLFDSSSFSFAAASSFSPVRGSSSSPVPPARRSSSCCSASDSPASSDREYMSLESSPAPNAASFPLQWRFWNAPKSALSLGGCTLGLLLELSSETPSPLSRPLSGGRGEAVEPPCFRMDVMSLKRLSLLLAWLLWGEGETFSEELGIHETPLISLTQHPGEDHPLHGGRGGALPVLPVLLRGDDVLGGEQQQEQEGQVGRRVADELDEGLADEEAVATLGGDEVPESEQGVEEADEDAGDELPGPVASPPARELVVPPGRQELLALRTISSSRELLVWSSRLLPPPPHLHAATGLLVIEQQLHRSHHFLPDGVQQGVAHVDAEAQQELDDLQVLVLDGDQQGGAAQRVDAVDVDLEVDLGLLRKKIGFDDLKAFSSGDSSDSDLTILSGMRSRYEELSVLRFAQPPSRLPFPPVCVDGGIEARADRRTTHSAPRAKRSPRWITPASWNGSSPPPPPLPSPGADLHRRAFLPFDFTTCWRGGWWGGGLSEEQRLQEGAVEPPDVCVRSAAAADCSCPFVNNWPCKVRVDKFDQMLFSSSEEETEDNVQLQSPAHISPAVNWDQLAPLIPTPSWH